MKELLSFLAFIVTINVAVPASAASQELLECNSGNVKISGIVNTRYLRMGHSLFTGNLSVYFYDHRRIVSSSRINVLSGDIQDEISIDTSMAKDALNRPVELNIQQDSLSTIKVGNSEVKFTPHCEITYQNRGGTSFSADRQGSNSPIYCGRPMPGIDCP